MGANGAGKSTLVKILTGAVHPDAGTILVRGEPYVRPLTGRGPTAAGSSRSTRSRPLIPDLDIRSNLRLTETPVEPFRHWLAELGHRRPGPVRPRARAAAGHAARHRPGAGARHRATRPDARRDDRGPAGRPDRARPRGHRRPARLRSLHHLHLPPTDRDRRGVRPRDRPPRRRDRRRGRRHRALRGPDRRPDARRQRQGTRDHGATATAAAERGARTRRPGSPCASCAPAPGSRTSPSSSVPARCSGWSLSRDRARTSCSTSSPGRDRPAGGNSRSTALPVSFRHPADAIRAGLVYVPADRAEALLMQRSVRENIALPFSAPIPVVGTDPTSRTSGRRVAGATDAAPDRHARGQPRSAGCRAATSRR